MLFVLRGSSIADTEDVGPETANHHHADADLCSYAFDSQALYELNNLFSCLD